MCLCVLRCENAEISREWKASEGSGESSLPERLLVTKGSRTLEGPDGRMRRLFGYMRNARVLKNIFGDVTNCTKSKESGKLRAPKKVKILRDHLRLRQTSRRARY